MPFFVSGQCYGTPAETLEAFQRVFPIMGELGVVDLHASSITASGVVSYNTGYLAWKSSNEVLRSATVNLVACSTPDALAFDPVAAGGVFAFFFLGVAMTWLLSQNIGLILEAIKKW